MLKLIKGEGKKGPGRPRLKPRLKVIQGESGALTFMEVEEAFQNSDILTRSKIVSKSLDELAQDILDDRTKDLLT